MRIFNKPPAARQEKDIFKDIDTLVQENYPCDENQHPIFKKFGVRIGGVADCWILKDNWQSLPEIDKWKYVAYCALYWEDRYRYWYEKKLYQEYLDYLFETAKQRPEFMETYNLLKEKENK